MPRRSSASFACCSLATEVREAAWDWRSAVRSSRGTRAASGWNLRWGRVRRSVGQYRRRGKRKLSPDFAECRADYRRALAVPLTLPGAWPVDRPVPGERSRESTVIVGPGDRAERQNQWGRLSRRSAPVPVRPTQLQSSFQIAGCIDVREFKKLRHRRECNRRTEVAWRCKLRSARVGWAGNAVRKYCPKMTI